MTLKCVALTIFLVKSPQFDLVGFMLSLLLESAGSEERREKTVTLWEVTVATAHTLSAPCIYKLWRSFSSVWHVDSELTQFGLRVLEVGGKRQRGMNRFDASEILMCLSWTTLCSEEPNSPLPSKLWVSWIKMNNTRRVERAERIGRSSFFISKCWTADFFFFTQPWLSLAAIQKHIHLHIFTVLVSIFYSTLFFWSTSHRLDS